MELTVSLFVPPHNPATVLLTRLGGELAERSGGALSLRVCHSEELGRTAAHYELACEGAADISYMIHSATPGRFPLTELAHLPPLGSAAAATSALQRALPRRLAQEHAGVHVLFLAANTPMAIHSVAPLRSLAELEGKRVGHTGRVVAQTMRALGAVPVTVMPLQIRDALLAGTIDATSMTYEAALVTRLAGAVRYSLELNANTLTFALVMNERRYRELSPELRQAVDEVLGASAGGELAALLTAAAEEGKHYLKSEGVSIVALDDGERNALASAARSVREGFIAELGAQGREVFHELKKDLA
jgi:TRAP-type C4-dicarboxylate transport system substrate-binding protein